MPANANVTQELEEAVEAVEAVDSVEAVDDDGAVEAVAGGGGGGGGLPDLNIYAIMLLISAAAYLGIIVILLFRLKEYSNPDQFLW